MEAALRSMLKDSLGEYVQRGLERADASSFPLVLRDLQLNAKKCQQEFDEDGTSAITLTNGKIGSIKVTPSWMGTVEVLATNIELSFAFSATKAMANAMKGNDDRGAYHGHEVAPQAAPAPTPPPPPCAPRFCCNHDSSDKRQKGEPVERACKSCGMVVTSSYVDFQLCPPCSDKEQRCLICGNHAPKAATYIPQAHVGPSAGQAQPMPHDKEHSRQGANQASNLPPPPPPASHRGGNGNGAYGDASHRAGNANGAYGEPPRDPSMLADTTRSMYLSRPALNESMYQPMGQPGTNQGPTPDYSTMLPQNQNYSTMLPQNHRAAPSGSPMGQNRSPRMSQRPRRQPRANDDDESFGGFLRFVASDVWGRCAPPAHGRMDSFGGPPAHYQQAHGFKRGGA